MAALLQSEGAASEEVAALFERAIALYESAGGSNSSAGGSGRRGGDSGGGGQSLGGSGAGEAEAGACYSRYGAWLWEVTGDHVRAGEMWRQALRLSPGNLAVLRGYARLLAQRALLALGGARGASAAACDGAELQRQARDLYARAVGLEPRHVATRYNHAAFLHRLSAVAGETAAVAGATAAGPVAAGRTGGSPAAGGAVEPPSETEAQGRSHVLAVQAGSLAGTAAQDPAAGVGGGGAGPAEGGAGEAVGGRADSSLAQAKEEYWNVLRLCPAHPPALCSLATLLQAESTACDGACACVCVCVCMYGGRQAQARRGFRG